MYDRLIKFLERHDSIFKRQFGFRKNHSTSHVLINITENIRKALDGGEFACGIFVDLQKAFDTVDHNILLRKLCYYGVRGLANSWFQSYLSNRKHYVSISGHNSPTKINIYGVPQGSVLGPLLFLLYINDLHNAIEYSSVYHFADDTNLLHINKSLKSLGNKLNIDLKLLCHWLNANKISLNRNKTEFVLFRPPRKNINYNLKLKLDGKRLHPSQYIKYLGIYIDCNLNWTKQVNEVALKLRRANGALCKIRHFVPKSVLLSVYYGIFNSHMQYACQVWAQHETSNTRRIFMLQKRALKIMTFSRYDSPSNPIFADLKLFKLFDLVKFFNIILIHNILNNKLPSDVQSVFSLTAYNRSNITRGPPVGTLKVPYVKTNTYGNFSVRYQSIIAWNALQREFPTNIANISINKIINYLKLYFLTSYNKL